MVGKIQHYTQHYLNSLKKKSGTIEPGDASADHHATTKLITHVADLHKQKPVLLTQRNKYSN